MKSRFIALALFAGVITCAAQEPPLPSNSPTPAGEPTPPETAQSPPPLIPTAPAPVLPPVPAAPDLSQLDAAFQRTPLGKAAEDYRLHVAWRKLQNRVGAEPQIVAAKNAAEATATDLEKRKRLRAYYALYYGRMAALADTPELKTFVEQQKAAHIATTAQDRVRPSPSPKAEKH